MTKEKIVKYKVTGAFGASPSGEIRDAILLAEDPDGEVLLYHPEEQGFCASIELAQPFLYKDDNECTQRIYISSCKSELFGWVNIDTAKDLEILIENLITQYNKRKRTKYTFKLKKEKR